MKIYYTLTLNVLFSFSLYTMDRKERIKAIEQVTGCEIEKSNDWDQTLENVFECISKNVIPKFERECMLNNDNKTFGDVQKCFRLKMETALEQIKKLEKTN